jgi:hypothetical protein
VVGFALPTASRATASAMAASELASLCQWLRSLAHRVWVIM